MSDDTHKIDETADILRIGLQTHRQGQLAEAEIIYGEVLRRDPVNYDALHYMGLIACQTRRFDRALDLITQAIRLAPDIAPFHSNRAVALNAVGRYEEALGDYDAAIAIDAGFGDAHFNRGNTLASLGRPDEAVASYDKAIALNPTDPKTHMQRGKALQAADRPDEAIASYDACLALAPVNLEALHLRANALKDVGQLEEAVASYDQVLAFNPRDPVAHSNRGSALRRLRRIDDAIDSYRRAIELQPDFAMAHHNLAVCLMTRGDWETGFRAYEWRKDCPDFESDPAFAGPVWTGEQDLAGKTLLIHPELFLGDLIQFSRYALAAEALGAMVKLVAPEPMRNLLKTLSPTIEVLSRSKSPGTFDYQCALMSLPLAFGTTPHNVPAPIPYLHAEPARIDRWKRIVGRDGLRIGICWQGSTSAYAASMQRSFALRDLHGIARSPGVRLISLQKHDGLTQLQDLPPGMSVETLGEAFDAGPGAFLDTAAVLASCDLVITADTAVAHLAGALGVRTWIALPYAPDWRWLLEGDHTPWYPTARLFRQAVRGDWTGVFAAMEASLAADITSHQA